MAEPEGLWGLIEGGLPAGGTLFEAPARRRPGRGLWWGIASGIAAGLALVLLLGRGGDAPSALQEDYVAVVEQPSVPDGFSGVPDVSQPTRPAVADESSMADLYLADIPAENAGTASVTEGGESEQNIEIQINEEKIPVRESSFDETEEMAQATDDSVEEHFLSAEIEDARRRRWTAGLTASNVPFGAASSSAGFSSATPARTDAELFVGALNMNRTTATSEQHYQPVRAGVMVSYAFADRWSVETGVTYAYLYSKFRSGSDNYYYNSTQSLHYVGIPLNVNFSVWRNDFLDVYISAGGLMEKCVGGSLSTTNVYNTLTGEPQIKKIGVKPLQWSVSASAGVQYRFSPWAGIFLEPGAAYYFANGSGVESAYTARPFNFNIELGVRFAF